MPRYKPYGLRDDPQLQEADAAFYGFRSRVQPAALPPGIARYIGNGRCDRGTFRPRKGSQAAGTDLVLSNPPVVLDFVLPTEISVTSLTRSGATVTATTATAHGYSTGDTIGLQGAVPPDYNGDWVVTVTGANTFTYAVAGTPATPAAGAMVCAKGLRVFDTYIDLVRGSCAYANAQNVEGVVLATTNRAFLYREGVSSVQLPYPVGETVQDTDACSLAQYLDKVYLFRGLRLAPDLAVSSLTLSGATATATTTVAHGRATGDWVTIIGALGVQYNGIFKITVTGSTSFTYALTGTPATPDPSLSIAARPCKPPLVWDGNLAGGFALIVTGAHPSGGTLSRMPATDWGVEFSRRLVFAYARDQLVLSDFGDANTCDLQYGQLRIRPGTADWLMGVAPFQDLRLLVLYRKSLHQVLLNTTTAAPAAVQEITRDFGCAARRSVANCGDAVLFLADQGVHGVQIDLNLNLVPLRLPLSNQIQDLIETINWSAAAGAVGKYFQNRYYLAVPTGTSTRNNTLLVFNFLNRSEGSPLGEWESVDTYPGDFDVQELHIINFGGRKALHAVTSYGWVFVLEQLEFDQWGNPSSSVGAYPVNGDLLLRDFLLGVRERKKFMRVRLATNVTAGDAYRVDFVARNPDSRTTIGNYIAPLSTDVDQPLRVPRIKGSAGTVEVVTTAGRPEIRSVELIGTVVDHGDTTRS